MKNQRNGLMAVKCPAKAVLSPGNTSFNEHVYSLIYLESRSLPNHHINNTR